MFDRHEASRHVPLSDNRVRPAEPASGRCLMNKLLKDHSACEVCYIIMFRFSG